MAELVDALVSKTSSFGSAGSTPAPGTYYKMVIEKSSYNLFYVTAFFVGVARLELATS